MRLFRREADGFDAAARNSHHLARLDFADVFRVDQIERAGFRGRHPGAVEAAQDQRAEAARVADGVHLIARQQQQRIGAFHLVERVGQRAGKIPRRAARDQMHDHFRVAGGLENRAAMFELAAQLERVRQVAVVRQRELALVAVDHDGLRVDQRRIAGGRIARVADGRGAGQVRDHFRRENLLHVAHGLVHVQVRAVGRGDASRFLPAMLQRVEAEIGQLRGLGMAENAEDAAVIVEVIVRRGCGFRSSLRSRCAFRAIAPRRWRNESTSPVITGSPLYWMRNSPRVTVPISLRLDIVLCRNCSQRGQAKRAQAIPPRARRVRRKARLPPALVACRASTSAERPSLAEAAFRERHGQAAVAHIVRGENAFSPGELHQAFDQPLFRGQVHRRRRARDDSMNRLRVLGRGKLRVPRQLSSYRVRTRSGLRRLARPSSSTIKSPSLRKPEPSAQSASSISPSTPRTGVG